MVTLSASKPCRLFQHQHLVGDIRGLVDHEALDLVEHRRMGRVRWLCWWFPGMMMRIGGLEGFIDTAGEVYVRSTRSPFPSAGRRTCRASRGPGGPQGSSAP